MLTASNPRQSPASAAPRDEVVSTRVFPYSREQVFEAFTDPDGLAAWWGPKGFTNRFHEFDFRPGGRWRFDMIGPDGAVYPQAKTFVEATPLSRIVLDHPQEGHTFRLAISLGEVPGGTRVTWRMRFATAAQLAPIEGQVIQGNEENFDRLAAHLAEAHGVVVTRTFKAPPERVFRAWTDPTLLKRWWAPEGCSTSHCTVDLRVGGLFHYCMRMPDGQDVWGRGIYREIVVPTRLVYVDSFADEQGNAAPPTRYGASADHPTEALVVVTFAPSGAGTTVTLRHAIPPNVPERAGAEQGWTEMLNRLAPIVEE